MRINKTSIPYLIHCLSPLHVGSGDSNYGIIDNLVQRDALTNHPIIHSSSLKGALREYFTYRFESSALNGSETANDLVQEIFGSDNVKRKDAQGNDIERDHKAGLFDFDLGFLLSIPIRSSKMLYANVTTPALIRQFRNRLEQYNYGGQEGIKSILEKIQSFCDDFKQLNIIVATDPEMENAVLEEFDFKVEDAKPVSSFIRKIFGDNLVIMPDDKFKDLMEALPVIARNKLENGQSVNLFYEEVVPRESRFFSIITTAHWRDRNNESQEAAAWFKTVMKDDELIQLGANASVGYGKTLFTQISNL